MNEFVAYVRNFTSPIEPWWTIVLVPIWQEIVFRYVPFQFWYLAGGNFWTVGIVSSLAFAAIHWYFGKWFLLYAFAGGVVLWWIMVNYGLVAAILAHALMNVIDLTFGIRNFLTR